MRDLAPVQLSPTKVGLECRKAVASDQLELDGSNELPGLAEFTQDGQHRLSLSRVWTPGKPWVLFVMLNPSIANDRQLDPTVRKCIGFAQRWGFGGLLVGNLYTLVSPFPERVRDVLDGPYPALANAFGADDALIRLAGQAQKIVVAWGTQPWLAQRAHDVTRVLSRIQPLFCLGKTADGWPRHPLYRAYEAELDVFRALTP